MNTIMTEVASALAALEVGEEAFGFTVVAQDGPSATTRRTVFEGVPGAYWAFRWYDYTGNGRRGAERDGWFRNQGATVTVFMVVSEWHRTFVAA